jgi:anti-anti-sigma factor
MEGPTSATELQVVRLEGELDAASAASAFGAVFDALGRRRTSAVLVDCFGISLLTAAALTMMIRAQRRADARGVMLVFARLRDLPLRTVRITGLDRRLTLIA